MAVGFPIVYGDEDYPEAMQDPNLSVQEFPNGDIFIISMDMDTREITVRRQIPPKTM